MRRLVVTLALLVALPSTASAADFRRCGNVGFTPQSDDIATEIRAAGVTCRYARDFVRDSEGRPRRSFRGWTCGRRSVDPPDGLAHTRYSCRRGSRIIRWSRY